MKLFLHRTLSAVALIAVGSVAAGCSADFEPQSIPPLESVESIYVSVPRGSTEALVLGKLYQQSLRASGRTTLVQVVDEDPISRFQSLDDGHSDLTIGCSGELLEYFNPARAAELEQEFIVAGDVDPNSGEWREKVYDALVGSLPGHLAVTDPSNAVACEDSNQLPQNIVPVYRKPSLNREERTVLNQVGGTISTDDVRTLVRDYREGAHVVASYLESKGLQ